MTPVVQQQSASQPAPKILGRANGKITSVAKATKGAGHNLKVVFPDPIGEVTVYVADGRELPKVGDTPVFIALMEHGALSPSIRLAGRLDEAKVQSVFK